MKYGVIDIGSNSVRLMISENGKTLYKLVNTTRLAEGMGDEKTLKEKPVERTVSAVSFFVEKAKTEKVDEIFIFATAAVRSSVNPEFFTEKVKRDTGYTVDVISGEMEATIGRIGAIGFNDGGVIDVGGASTEIVAVKNNSVIFSKSLPIGAVKIYDFCGQDVKKAREFILKNIEKYGDIPNVDFCSIGGTATTIASIVMELDPYDPNLVDGFEITDKILSDTVDKLYSLTVEQRRSLKGLQPARAEVIAGGALLLLEVIRKIGVDKFTVSEKDNLEGYLAMVMERK